MTMFEASSALAIASFGCLAIAGSCFFFGMTERCNVAFVFAVSLCFGMVSLAVSSLLGTFEFMIGLIR